MKNSVISKGYLDTFLMKNDKAILLKYLLEENNFKPAENSIDDFEKFQKSFKERNVFGLAELKEVMAKNNVNTVNESDIDRFFSVINLAKSDKWLLNTLLSQKSDTKEITVIKSGEYKVRALKEIQGYVTGVILEMGSPIKRDLQGQYINSEEEIFKTMANWMVNYRQYGLQHKEALNKEQVFVIENWQARQDETFGPVMVPKGSWLHTSKVNDSVLLDELITGQKTGYSIGGYSSLELG